MTRSQRDDLDATIVEQPVSTDQQRVRALLHDTRKGGVDLTIVGGREKFDLRPCCRSCCLDVLDERIGTRFGRIYEHGESLGFGYKFLQKPKPLRRELPAQTVD